MKYKIMIKQIDVVEVNAITKEQALDVVRNKLDPRALVELDVIEEAFVEEGSTREVNP